MTLAAHAVVGSALVQLMPKHPVLGFLCAFMSHFFIDAIPHGHYRISSMKINPEDRLGDDMILGKDFFIDLSKISTDFLVGIGLSFIFLNLSSYLLLCLGIIGGVLPDALQFVYWKIRKEPLISLQKFHVNIMHTKKILDSNLLATYLIETITILISIFAAHLF